MARPNRIHALPLLRLGGRIGRQLGRLPPEGRGHGLHLADDRSTVAPSGALLLSLLLAAAALLVLSKLDHTVVRLARGTIADGLVRPLSLAHEATAPVRQLLREARRYGEMVAEIERLKQANAELKAEAWRARDAEQRIEQLGKLMNAVGDRTLPRLTGRVVAETQGPFAKGLLLSAGRQHGVRPGYPVISTEGLVGRVVEVGDASARVLLLTDYASRVPVQIGPKAIRGIVIGDGSGRPRLGFLQSETAIAAGDDISTSGDGGVLPRGLRIGTVVTGEKDWRVALQAAGVGIDYVDVLQVDTPEGVLWQADGALPRSTKSLRRAAAMRAAGVDEEAPP